MNNPNSVIIEFKNVSKGYAQKILLKDTSFKIYNGGFFFLSGAIGTGKTTILKMVQQIEVPDQGNILVEEKKLNFHSRLPEYRHKVGIVFQDHKLIMHRNVANNISLPLQILGFSKIEAQKRVKETARYCGVHKLLSQPVFSLSVGEKQLVAIARATVHKPKILLVDEPTANLDTKSAEHVFHLLEGLNKKGTTVLFATHDIQLMQKSPKNILWIKNQKVVEIMVGNLRFA